MSRQEHHDKESDSDSGWLERVAQKKRQEKEALSRVFSSDQESRKKDMDHLQEIMKKEEEPPEEKGGPLYTPISKDLTVQREKKKAMSKVFSSEQERREKQRQALKSWILAGSEKDEAGEKDAADEK
jgi:hypothetical protein